MLEKGILIDPDLSLHISPPKTGHPSSSSSSSSFDIWQQRSQIIPQVDTQLSLSNHNPADDDMSAKADPFLFRPIRGIPVYNNSNGLLSSFSSSSFGNFRAFQQQPVGRFHGITMEGLKNQQQQQQQQQEQKFVVHQSSHFGVSDLSFNNRSNRLFMPRIQSSRRNARAPRMRWTSSLHARFIRAVQLLGGHERATPKSVLELMDVKDLTLAHVKSHLQMYRTVKNTDKQTVSSEGSGEEDFLPATPTPHHEANCLVNHRRGFNASNVELDFNGSSPSSINNPLSNSSRRAWEQGSPRSVTVFGSENQQEENYELGHPNNSLMGLNLNLNSPSKEFSMRHNWHN